MRGLEARWVTAAIPEALNAMVKHLTLPLVSKTIGLIRLNPYLDSGTIKSFAMITDFLGFSGKIAVYLGDKGIL
ncbi:MAG: hypothetical protein ACFFCW_46415 [Candidatus Hodarchaeota archaeon]